jgi:sugar O-acyltransferase (sialic acid O-acetyltransferase NeuD family)
MLREYKLPRSNTMKNCEAGTWEGNEPARSAAGTHMKELRGDPRDTPSLVSAETTLLVIGTGGFALEAATIAEESRGFSAVNLIANDAALIGSSINGFIVTGTDSDLSRLRANGHSWAFVGIGSPKDRCRMSELCAGRGYTFPTLKHSASYIAADVTLGEGTIIYPNVTIMPACSFGRGCLINANVSIGHECSIGNYVNINPGANIAGRVRIEDGAHIGIGAVILENRRIGDGAIVGAGSVVTRDVTPGCTVIGIPARPRP